MPTTNQNPYEATTTNPAEPPSSVRWMRPIVILNFLLLGIPASAVGFEFVLMQHDLRRQTEAYTDGPTTYETQFTEFSGAVWPLLVYFLTPNVLMVAFLMRRVRRRHRASV